MTRPMRLTRRRFVAGSLAGGAAATVLPRAAGADYPVPQIEALIPFSPGGGTDRSVRVVTPAWERALGLSRGFRLNHMPGAGSLIAQNALQQRAHDGSAVLFTPAPHVAWLHELEDEFSVGQVAWVGAYFQDPNVLLVPRDSPYETMEQFLDAAADASTPFTASVSSPMSAAHAATVVLRERAGIPMTVVPFEGGAEARNAVAGGHVDCCMAPYWSAINVLDLTRALAIFWDEDPTQGLWDAPPAREVLDFEMPNLHEPYGVVVSAATQEQNPEVYEQLVSTFREALESEEFRQAADEQDLLPFVNPWGPEECEAFIGEYLDLLAAYRASMERDVAEM
jgi:putative tricarboxylic transport membrane protein